MTDDVFQAIPFRKPSSRLFALLDFLTEAHEDLSDMMLVEFSSEELRAFGELTPRMVDKLLTQGELSQGLLK